MDVANERASSNHPRVGHTLTAEAGVALVAFAVNEDMRFIFRPLPTADMGIDGQIEIVAQGAATGRIISVQVKSGESYFRLDRGDHWDVPITRATVEYWRRHSVPVILVIADVDRRQCYWARGDGPALRESAASVHVRVPKAQLFDASAKSALVELAGGTFVTTDQYFRHTLEPGPTFNHSRPLGGRDHELRAIHEAVRDASVRVILLGGRGGIGKTRLLIEFARGIEEGAAWCVRWLPSGTPLAVRAFDELPPSPVVVIVDDVHRRSDVDRVLRLAIAREERTVIVAGTRPWARQAFLHAFRTAELPQNALRDVGDLGELRQGDLRILLVDELGPEFEDYADVLVERTGETTLVAVTAARLLRTRLIPPALLERQEDFQREVLDRFADEMLGQIGLHVDAAQAKALLRLMSLIGPVDDDDEEWLDASVDYLQVTRGDLVELVGHLEVAEVMGRKAGLLRVIPDVLADHLAHSAIFSATGKRTGREREVLARFGPRSLPRLVANLAELDWRLAVTGTTADVLAAVWPELDELFRASANTERAEILDALVPVAEIQPRRVLEICRWLADHPSGEQGDALWPKTHEDVLKRFPKLLSAVATDSECLRPALDLLWSLARRNTSNGSDYERLTPEAEAIREIIRYHPAKPIEVQQQALDALRAWIAVEGWDDEPLFPFFIADRLLSKEETLYRQRGLSLSMSAYALAPQPTERIRLNTVVLLGMVASDSSAPRAALAAVEALVKGLRSPEGAFAREVTQDEEEGWSVQDGTILDQLERLARDNANALIRIRIRDRLSWFEARGGTEAVRSRAGAIRSLIEETDELAVVRAYGHMMPSLPFQSAQEIELHVSRERDASAQTLERAKRHLLERVRSPQDLVTELRRLYENFARAHQASSPSMLLSNFGSEQPLLAANTVDAIILLHDDLVHAAAPLLRPVREMSPDDYTRIMEQAVSSRNAHVRLAGAQVLATLLFSDDLTDAELAWADSLVGDDSAEVRRPLVMSLAMSPRDRATTVRFLCQTKTNDSPELAEEFARGLEHVVRSGTEDLDELAVRDVLSRLVHSPKLDRSHCEIEPALTQMARRHYGLVVDFVLGRLGKQEAEHDGRELFAAHRYDAIPDDWNGVWKALQDSPAYVQLLTGLRDMSLSPRFAVAEQAADAFAAVANADHEAVGVLLEWIRSDREEERDAAARILDRLRQDFVLAAPALVARILDASRDPEQRERLAMALKRSALGGRFAGVARRSIEVQLREQGEALASRFPKGSAAWEFFRGFARETPGDSKPTEQGSASTPRSKSP